ncbi:MAG: thiamine pyrophosphate-binding protein [Armatimonadota bacterium]
MQRVADYIAEYIWNLGVEHVFMVSGGGMMFLSDGLALHPHLKVVCTHHEQASAMGAVGYAKYREGLGVAYVTTGCGGTNAITGLLDAWQDNVPCIFISGQCKRKETVRNSGLRLRQFGVQEADIIAIVEPITKYAVMVNEPDKIAWHLDRAVHLARSGRPGPVWLDIPMDVQGAMIDEKSLMRYSPEPPLDYKEEPTDEDLQSVADLLNEAGRPIIIAGQGIRLSGAVAAFRAFIERYRIPVVASRLGIDLLPGDHPLFIGRIGNKGDRAGNFAVQNADLVLAIGSRLSVSSTGHEYGTFAREAKTVVVDIDPVEHRKNTVRIDRFINADAKQFIERFSLPTPPKTDAWTERCLAWKKKWPVCIPEYAVQKEGINLYYFVDRLSAKMGKDTVVVSDAGSAFYVVSQGIMLKDGQRYVTSGGQADMGYTLPSSIGVSVAGHGREVLAVTGDGSFQMNIQELQTIVHYDLPVKIFVWNNDGYLSIRATQAKFFDRRFIGTDSTSGVSFPSFQKIADAYGIPYFQADDPARLDAVIDQVLAVSGPVICEVLCIRDQEIVPTVASYRKDDGTMVSRPIEDMYPFLDRAEFQREMIVKPLRE